jgi:hypothetical protein
MATTTATLTLSSGDLTGDALALSTTATLTKAGVLTGLDQSTGVGRKTTSATAAYKIADKTVYSDAKAHKIYVKNISTTAAEFVTITVEDQPLGRLYAGDWAFLPYAGDKDVFLTPSVSTALTVEFLVIYEV